MLHKITHAFHQLDEWLQDRLGRPYNALLGIGLAIEIGRRISEAPKALASVHGLVGTLLVLFMEMALLIHQIGALSHHIERRKRGRKAEGPEAPADAPAPERPEAAQT
jgi:hypothetical protein